jgi:hypothetical protein
MKTGSAAFVWAIAHDHSELGGNEDFLAPTFEYLTKDFFRNAMRIDVGGIEEIDASLNTHVHLTACSFHIRRAHLTEKAFASEGHSAKAKH